MGKVYKIVHKMAGRRSGTVLDEPPAGFVPGIIFGWLRISYSDVELA